MEYFLIYFTTLKTMLKIGGELDMNRLYIVHLSVTSLGVVCPHESLFHYFTRDTSFLKSGRFMPKSKLGTREGRADSSRFILSL